MKMPDTIKTAFLLIMFLTLTGCFNQFSKLKNEQFDVLRTNVTQILGEGYEVKEINVSNEGYTDDGKTEYVVDYSFTLNKPFLLLPSSNLPGKMVFKKDDKGDWKCTFNSGNPSELFNLLR